MLYNIRKCISMDSKYARIHSSLCRSSSPIPDLRNDNHNAFHDWRHVNMMLQTRRREWLHGLCSHQKVWDRPQHSEERCARASADVRACGRRHRESTAIFIVTASHSGPVFNCTMPILLLYYFWFIIPFFVWHPVVQWPGVWRLTLFCWHRRSYICCRPMVPTTSPSHPSASNIQLLMFPFLFFNEEVVQWRQGAGEGILGPL